MSSEIVWTVKAAACAAILLWGSAGRADTVLVDENLDDGACDFAGCQVAGGQFMSNQGWKVTSYQSQMVFDLSQLVPNGIACGRVEVEFTGFDPISHYHGGSTYVNIVGMYEGAHGSNWTASGNDESQLQVSGRCVRCVEDDPSAWWRDNRLKFKGHSCSWDYESQGYCVGFPDMTAYVPSDNTYDIDWSQTLSAHYVTSVSWDCSGTTYELDDGAHHWTDHGSWTWHPDHADPKPHFRFVFVGRDNKPGNDWIGEALFVRVRVVEHDACNCVQCTPGQVEQQNCGDCGTRQRTCDANGQWSTFGDCQGPDPNDACDTGLQGLCAEGIRVCSDGYLVCQQTYAPKPEQCGDARDNDCDGRVDEGCDGFEIEVRPDESPVSGGPSEPEDQHSGLNVFGGCSAAVRTGTLPGPAVWLWAMMVLVCALRKRKV